MKISRNKKGRQLSANTPERPRKPSRLNFIMLAIGRILSTAFALVVCLGAAAQPLPADRALITAAEKGDSAAVKRLLAEGASVAARDGRKRTPLLAATQGNHVAAAQALIEAGADVNAQDDMRDSAFLLAGARLDE